MSLKPMIASSLTSTIELLTGDLPTWRAGPRLLWLCSIASIGAIAFVTAESLVWLSAENESKILHQQIESVKLSSAARATQPVAAPALSDFTHHLPSTLDVQPVIIQLQRSCTQAGVELASSQIQQQAATADHLSRTELNITLRGNYPATKTVLGEVIGRYPNMSLRHLSMRNSTHSQPTNTEIETTAVLALWGAPADSARNPAPGAQAH